MTMDNNIYIHSYDLFLFDLDGTIVNSESLHHKAYLNSFEFFNIPLTSIAFDEYCRYAHLDDVALRDYVSAFTNITFDKVYAKKKEIFLKLLDIELHYIEGAEKLLHYLRNNHKKAKICIVTNSDGDIFKKMVEKLPLLQQVDYVLTGTEYMNKKPHPECYIKACKVFENQCRKPIGFEDSYKGYLALKRSNVTAVFIGATSYPYFNKLKPPHHFENFNKIDWTQLQPSNSNYSNFVDLSLNRYATSLTSCKDTFGHIMKQIIPLLKYHKGNTYLAGIGKCGYICMKSVSTWQSLGIACHYLNIPNLFHGEFGILKNNDIIIYVSKSGNTEEMLKCCSHIKEHFPILQIGLTMHADCQLKQYVNFHYVIVDNENNIHEIDSIDMAPTTSSVLFLILLDMLGVQLSEDNDFAIEKFQRYHPAGELGKKQSN